MPGAHIIVVGVNASRELVAELINSGAAGVAPHTIDDKELMDAIRTAAAGGVVLSKDAFMDLLQGQAKDGDDPLERLTPIERELFDLVGEGCPTLRCPTLRWPSGCISPKDGNAP